MDYNTGLTQALLDGTNTYIYGLDRIAQTHASTADYFLTDALGSVRQLTDPTGAITFARTYDPYGVTTQTTGAAQTAYGYTGEFTANNLVYLRARQYAPGMGRFLTRDTWGGDVHSPMSYNAWNYVSGNPVNRLDPTGRCWITGNGTQTWIPDGAAPCTISSPQLPAPALSIPSYPDDTGYPPAQDIPHYNDKGEEDGTYYNLCGLFSAEIILEAIMGRLYDIRDVMKFNDTWIVGIKKDHGLGIGGEGDLLAEMLGNRADVIGYYGMNKYYFHGSINNRTTISLARNWETGLNLLSVMDSWIRRGAYITVTGILNQDKPSVENPYGRLMVNEPESVVASGEHMKYVSHWVVVRWIDGDWITIVNPFYNRLETYSWSEVFQGSMRQNGNTAICVDPTKTGVCDLNLPKAK